MNLPDTLQGLQNLAAGDAVGKIGKILPQVSVIGLTALIAWQLARFVWMAVPRPAELPLAAPVVAAPAGSVRGSSAQKIADSHLFGVANAASPTDLENVQQTNMTLVLSGTIASKDPAYGFAFIGETAATAKLVAVGQSIAGAARLSAVYPDRVILDRGGRQESLMLPRLGSSILGSRPQQAAAFPTSRFGDNIKRIAETNPAVLTEIVRPQAAVDKGVMQGFRVYPGRNRQQFARLGLQPGDLVKAINGTPLDDPQRSSEIFNTLSASDRAQITIERNGKIEQLTLNTSQLTLPEPGADPQPQGTPPQEIRNFDATGAPVQ